MEELGEVPEGTLSLVALAEDVSLEHGFFFFGTLGMTSFPQMLQPKYTMDGLEVLEDSITGMSIQYRVLRTLLTANLPTLQYGLQQKISKSFEDEVSSSSPSPDCKCTPADR